ncbi:MAG: DNA polymerase III subunit delta [Thermodesulfobacteriota bacterium]
MANQPDRELFPVYLLYGNEGALVEDEVGRIREEALKGGMADFNFHLFIAREADAAEIVSVAMTMPAMARRRVVVVKGIDSLKARNQDILVDYVKAPSPSTCLLLTAETGKVNKGSALYRAVAKSGHIELFNRLSSGRLESIIRQEVRDGGKRITDEAVARLLSLTGNNLRSVRGELQKALLFVGSKAVIDHNDIDDGVADVKEESIFDLADAIGKREGSRAISIFNKVSDEAPVKLLGAITRQFRILWKVKALRKRGIGQAKLPSHLRVPPYQVQGYVARSNRFTEDELSRIFHRLRVIDREIKSGGVPHRISLNRFIVQLCS